MRNTVTKAELEAYLDAVVELTRYHDARTLAAALVRLVRLRLGARRVRMLALSNDTHDAEFSAGNADTAVVYDLLESDTGRSWLLTQDRDLLECVRTGRAIDGQADGERRLVVPVPGARAVSALLLVQAPGTAHVPHALLARLLRAYGNQMFLLSYGQLDPLTGLYNRQSFYERIRRVVCEAVQYRRASDSTEQHGNCFALLDIDHFKDVNDRYGHLYGDEVLLLMARLMMRSFRREDLLFRYGGEEFAAVLVNVDLPVAERLLERFRAAVEAYAFPRLEPKTVSIGVTALDMERGIDRVVMCADSALYYAKNHGRNRVCCYERLVAQGELQPVALAEGDIELF